MNKGGDRQKVRAREHWRAVLAHPVSLKECTVAQGEWKAQPVVSRHVNFHAVPVFKEAA